MLVNAFSPSTQEAQAAGSLRSRPTLSMEQVTEQLGLYREILSGGGKKERNLMHGTAQELLGRSLLSKFYLLFEQWVLQWVLRVFALEYKSH